MKKSIFTVRELVVCAMLVALFVAQSFLNIYITPAMRISFEFLPLAIAGYLYGPFAAMLVGGIGDFLGIFWKPSFTPFYTIVFVIGGLIFGLLLHNNRKETRKVSQQIRRIILACLTYAVIVDVVLSSVVLHFILNFSFEIVWRLLKGVIVMVMYPVAVIPIFKLIDKVYKRETV